MVGRVCTRFIWHDLIMVRGCDTDLLINVVRLFIPSAVAAMVTSLCNASLWQVYPCLAMQVQSSIYS
jgi:hypothetical protein